MLHNFTHTHTNTWWWIKYVIYFGGGKGGKGTEWISDVQREKPNQTVKDSETQKYENSGGK